MTIVNLRRLTDDQLLVLVADILSGQGTVLTTGDICHLADINEEFQRREVLDPLIIMERIGVEEQLEPEGRGKLERASHYLIFERGKALYGFGQDFGKGGPTIRTQT